MTGCRILFRTGLLLGILFYTAHALGATFRKGPYLVYDGNNTRMEVHWQASGSAASSTIEWGPTTAYGNGPITVTGNASDQFSHAITGLTPGSYVCYRVSVDSNTVTGNFTAAPPATGQSLSFYAMGDTRTGVTAYDSICSQIMTDLNASPSTRQTLWIHSGDWVGAGDNEGDWDWQFFAPTATNALALMTLIPVVGCRGNHEQTGGLLRKYWPYPYQDGTGCYFSIDYGPVHFTIIDQYVTYTSGSTQYNWINSDLAGTSKHWKVVTFHAPAWSAGGHANDTTTQTHLCPLFQSHGVQVVVSGHNHYYARCLPPSGIHHLTAGGGGAPLYTPNLSDPHVVTATRAHSFVRFDVNGGTMNVTAIDTNGATIDNFTIAIPFVNVTPVSGLSTMEGAGPTQFSVALSTVPTADVTIALQSGDLSEGTVLPSSLTFTPGNATTPQNVLVFSVDDQVIDGNVSFSVLTQPATSSDVNYNGFDAPDVSVINLDDDVPSITVVPATDLITTEGGGTDTFFVALGTFPAANVTVNLTSNDTTEGAVSPSSLTFTPSNGTTPQMATVTGLDDGEVDGDQAFSVVTQAATSTDANYDGLDGTDVTVTNRDDDVRRDDGKSCGCGPGEGPPEGFLAFFLLLMWLLARSRVSRERGR